MLRSSGRPYICWRCTAGHLGRGSFPPLPRTRPITGPLARAAQYTHIVSRRGLATVHHSQSDFDAVSDGPVAKPRPKHIVPIRERLRQWQTENSMHRESMLSDYAEDGEVSNNLTRPQNISMAQVNVPDSTAMFVGDELVDLRSDDASLSVGDMVELSSDNSRRPVLAICLGRINGLEHFYTSSGKWFSSTSTKVLFVVNNFVSPQELKPVIDALPPFDDLAQQMNALQDLVDSPSRSQGAGLIRKMLQFTQDAEAVYQANADTLDGSSSFIGHPTEHRYLTLHDIAGILLRNSDKYGHKFSPHSLYAVHRSLLQDEVFFRPLRYTGHRRSYMFEVSPLSEVQIIQNVEKIVHDYVDMRGDSKLAESLAKSPVVSFAKNAQKAIDESRKHRTWSEYGLVGPSTEPAQLSPDWSATDLEILHFIELWVSYQKFPAYSRLQTLGSILLRAISRYEEARGYVPAVGWTLLQEVGWIPPWEIPARYSTRFPGVDIKRGGSYTRPQSDALGEHLTADALQQIRTPLEDSTAYCIDDVTAREIDDAVSLQLTSNPDECWIHVHVADPASSFGPDTPVAKYAELIPEAIYLPGHLESMLPDSVIHGRFSLAPDRPCLTFSALVNSDGAVLDEKITANTLKKVVYMTYEDAASAIGETRVDPYAKDTQWGLGAMPEVVQPVNRKMSRPDELTQDQKNDLAILSKFGKAVQAKRLEKGATPTFLPRPMAVVDFSGVKKDESKGFIATSGDPSVHIRYSRASGADLVENAMKLANEVAARWCHKRDIPIPYRTQPHALRNAALVQQYARDVLNPLLASGAEVDEAIWIHMRSLIGVDEVSTTPGPHFTLGSDMYTKATSPLRRFGDLIVHWQIEATLLKEAKGSKISNEDRAYLPFDREKLDRMLPELRLREKLARSLTNVEGIDQWILQAMVRAWRFKEGSLPETFKMTVRFPAKSRAIGRLDWFDRTAILKFESLNKVILGADIRVGDVIEVRLTDINAYSKQIFVEAVRVLERSNQEIQKSNDKRTSPKNSGAEAASVEII